MNIIHNLLPHMWPWIDNMMVYVHNLNGKFQKAHVYTRVHGALHKASIQIVH